MSLVKTKELRKLSVDELVQRSERLNKELFDLVQKREIGQLDRPHRFSAIRKEKAQILTVLREKSQLESTQVSKK